MLQGFFQFQSALRHIFQAVLGDGHFIAFADFKGCFGDNRAIDQHIPVFDIVLSLAQNCKFKDCTHTNETGCSVIEAVENGKLDKSIFENYQKMQREKLYFETSLMEKRKKEKIFGKIVKDYYKKDVKGKKY